MGTFANAGRLIVSNEQATLTEIPELLKNSEHRNRSNDDFVVTIRRALSQKGKAP